MITTFVVICVGMVLGMLLIRLLDEASRTIAAIPTDAAAARADATAAAAPPAPQSPAAPAPAGTPAISTEIRVIQPNYTVAPGDTLGSIARRHGTSVDALASINNLENRNSLSVGQKLIIP
jgi:nucleoid-associated protein YgaU